jgi:hypothetical protein
MKSINPKPRRIVFIIFFLFVFSHHAVAGWSPFKGKTREGKKAYLGPAPVQDTEAYQKFLESSRSEIDKLYYLGDRIRAKTAQKNVYIYERDRYHWAEVYAGGIWCLWHYYKREKTAREFVRDISQRFERPGSRATVEFPDGSVHYAYQVTVNELDLLEETIKPEPQTP